MSTYSKLEEKLNIYTHLLGAILGLIGLVLLILKSFEDYSLKESVSFVIFGLGIIAMFMASVIYHNTEDIELRFKRKVLDHCAIYIMIAGTYTPLALAAIGGTTGWFIFGLSWGFALIGITLKLFFTGRFKLVSTLMYVFMGWMIVLFIRPLINEISQEGFNFILAGGISYTVGAIAYLIKKLSLNHAIFHVFVLGGSICHFLAVYLYV